MVKKKKARKFPKVLKDYVRKYTYTVRWSTEDNLYVVSVAELPGCMTHGKTLNEAIRMGHEAATGYLESLCDSYLMIPKPGCIPVDHQTQLSFKNLDIEDVIMFRIVGLQYQFKKLADFENYFENGFHGVKFDVKAEPKNKHDRNACAVYVGKKRIGYVDRFHTPRIRPFLKKYENLSFYLLDLELNEPQDTYQLWAIGFRH